MKELDQRFHVSDKKIVLLFALLCVNVLSGILIQLTGMLSRDSSELWVMLLGGYLGYCFYFMMLSLYVSALRADRTLRMQEMIQTILYSLLFSLLFYSCSSLLSYYGFVMLMGKGSFLLSLLIMLFILLYIPYSLLCMFQFIDVQNPFKIVWHSACLLAKHIRACLGLVCVIALLEGLYMALSNSLFQTSLSFQPLVYVSEILTCANPWSALNTEPFSWLLFTLLYGVIFAFVFFYGLHLVKDLVENQ